LVLEYLASARIPLLGSGLNFANGSTKTKRDIRWHLNNMISKAVYEIDPEHKIFISHGGGSYSVSIEVKHATDDMEMLMLAIRELLISQGGKYKG
jgi:hypothetical protein